MYLLFSVIKFIFFSITTVFLGAQPTEDPAFHVHSLLQCTWKFYKNPGKFNPDGCGSGGMPEKKYISTTLNVPNWLMNIDKYMMLGEFSVICLWIFHGIKCRAR